MNKLNQRQRMFTLNYFKTGNAKQSAIDAGYAVDCAEVTGCKLVRNAKVSAYLAELNSHMEVPTIATVSKRKEILTDIANDNHKIPLTAKERVLAISELNKMEGDYAPEKHLIRQETIIRFIIGKGYIDNA